MVVFFPTDVAVCIVLAAPTPREALARRTTMTPPPPLPLPPALGGEQASNSLALFAPRLPALNLDGSPRGDGIRPPSPTAPKLKPLRTRSTWSMSPKQRKYLLWAVIILHIVVFWLVAAMIFRLSPYVFQDNASLTTLTVTGLWRCRVSQCVFIDCEMQLL